MLGGPLKRRLRHGEGSASDSRQRRQGDNRGDSADRRWDEGSRRCGIVRATAHEAIKMKKGILPLIPSKFARAENGIMIPVSLTQYCVQGETRRGRQTRHGIIAADPRIFPLARYVEVFLGDEYLGRYLVDDTGGNVLGATLDIWNPDCREAARFGRHWGNAILVAREVEHDSQRFPDADALGRTRQALASRISRA